MKVIILYQSNGLTYGHTRMAHNLALELMRRSHQVSLLNLGTPQSEFPFHPQIEVNDLKSMDQVEKLVCAKAPDLLITEFYPFGRAHLRSQMRSFLHHAKSSLKNLKVACSMREFVGRKAEKDQPNKLEKHAKRISHDLENFYDLLLVFAPERLKNSFDVSLPPKFLEEKTHWCGYLVDQAGLYFASANYPLENIPRHDCIVGFGGAADPHKIYNITSELGREFNFKTVYVLSHKAQYEFAQNQMGDEFSSFRTNFPAEVARAKLAILYSGYGNTAERLSSGLPTLFISTEAHLEQQLRIESVSHFPNVRTLKHEDLSLSRVREALKELIQIEKSTEIDLSEFQGASVAANQLENLVRKS